MDRWRLVVESEFEQFQPLLIHYLLPLVKFSTGILLLIDINSSQHINGSTEAILHRLSGTNLHEERRRADPALMLEVSK
jgi:hypothetical protein